MIMPDTALEMERVVELSELDLDYSNLQEEFKDLTSLAAKISGTPCSLINLLDNFTQWTISASGMEAGQVSRDETVCQYTIQEKEDLEIKDLSEDERFKNQPYVLEGPRYRYYYGIPLEIKSGVRIGALCVLDSVKGSLSADKKEMLKLIAREIVNRLMMLKKNKGLRNKNEKLKATHRKLSHDIRGPIGGIIGLADILKSDVQSLDQGEMMELFSLIKEGGESVLEMADEIMAGKKEKEQPGEHEFSCGTFTEKLRELYKPQAINKDIELNIQTSSSTDNIFFPKAKLIQVAGNLISNSIKFTPKGGKVDVIVQVEEQEQKVSNRLKVKVNDSGIGMSQEKIERIINGNNDSSSCGTEGEAGYGFGLKLVRDLVKKAEGEMKVDSEPGKGSSFEVTLPV